MLTIAIVTPSIPPRAELLDRARHSVDRQDAIDCDIRHYVAHDHLHEGAWATRNRALRAALADKPDWVGFLDDDDELCPHHVSHLLQVADREQAAMVWGWFQIVYPGRGVQPPGVGDPFAHLNDGKGYRGKQYDPAAPHVVPITYMVRADVLVEAMSAGAAFEPDTIGSWDLQDKPMIEMIWKVSGGALFADERTTWLWHHWGTGSRGRAGNTSGMPDRW